MVNIRKGQLPFAAALGLTRVAARVKGDVERQIDTVFDRPISFTRKSVGMKAATKTNLRSIVFIKDKQAEYLDIQEDGGRRSPRGKALLVPAGQKTNKYGNLSRSAVKNLFARPTTFSAKINGTAGLWRRHKTKGPKLLLTYAQKADYQPRFHFGRTVKSSYMKHGARIIRDAASKASLS